MRHLLIAFVIAALPALTAAHSKISTTVPAQGAVVESMPQSVVFTFAKPLRLTLVRMGGDALDLPEQAGFGTEITVPLPPAGPGARQIEWRGLSADGHPVKGLLEFTVK